MKILVGKTFGLGNAVMCVPMLKALRGLGHDIDILVGNTPDDVGALEVFRALGNTYITIDNIWTNRVSSDVIYDYAIMSIPFDGRWRNGEHFKAKHVLDGRTRPDPSTTGLISWKKHEVEYQIDNAKSLGFLPRDGHVPNCSFMLPHAVDGKYSYYFGVGYKKDAAGFWKKKHWGNANYADLAALILRQDERNRIYVTGDVADIQLSIRPIMSLLSPRQLERFHFVPGGLKQSLDVVNDCEFYVGNDTGMMHVAAARGRKVVGLFFLENSITKNRPWCDRYVAVDGFDHLVWPGEVFQKIKELQS